MSDEQRARDAIRRDTERLREAGVGRSDASRIAREANDKLSRALDKRKG